MSNKECLRTFYIGKDEKACVRFLACHRGWHTGVQTINRLLLPTGSVTFSKTCKPLDFSDLHNEYL